MSVNWTAAKDQLQEKLRNHQAEHLRLLENIPEVVWRGNENGDAIFISERIGSVFGYTPEEVLTRGSQLWFSRMHPEDRDFVKREYAELFRNGRRFDVKYRIQHRDGHWMWWHDRAVLVEDASAASRYADGILSDVTEMKKLEEQLQQAHKMEAVGQLAGGIAHDFNNLIQVIGGYVELLQKRVEDDPKANEYSLKIKAAADRAGALTQQLLAFSRKQLQEIRVLDLNQTVSQVCSILDRVLGENVELVLRLTSDSSAIRADKTQIEQVLMNLAVNARDAMPSGGKLVIQTERVAVDEPYAEQNSGLTPGHYILLTVSDTGTGMDSATLSRAFEPFFTTKETGRGTGLGLAMVYGIVKQSGGHTCVYSEKGNGASFRIYWPASSAAQQHPSVPLPAAEGGGETVLLVEDEAAVRDLARIMLEKLGYRVLVAWDANSAQALAEGLCNNVQLLLTDVVMPGSSGRAIAENLSQFVPGIRVLYMTGYTDDALLHRQLGESNASILRKPFSKEQLATAVRNTLDGQSYRQLDCQAAELARR